MMKKVLCVGLAVAGLAYFGLLPVRATDVSKLLPVETVIVTRDGTNYRVDVGAGVRAVGKTVSEALRRLKEEVTGAVFFQSAEQVVVEESAQDAVPEIVTGEDFRPSAGLWLTPEAGLDAEAVSAYLKPHPTPLTLGQAQAQLLRGEDPALPRLVTADGGYRIVA